MERYLLDYKEKTIKKRKLAYEKVAYEKVQGVSGVDRLQSCVTGVIVLVCSSNCPAFIKSAKTVAARVQSSS